MNKAKPMDDLTKREKKGAVEAASAAGMESVEVFEALVKDIYDPDARKGMIVHWARKMHVPPSDAFRTAQEAALIPKRHKPFGTAREKPRQKNEEKT
ncbi:MAG: hypothetical protein WBE97_12900 [Candidatus Acidiferrales bacterium]